MLDRIMDNIGRQEKGLQLLHELLEAEFSLLKAGDPHAVTSCELSIQELLRQLAVEKLCLKNMVREMAPDAQVLTDLMDVLDKQDAEAIRELLTRVDAVEQQSAIQAEKNAQLALALAEQSKGMLDFMHKQIQPKNENTYSQRGKYNSSRPEAALFQGRS